MKKTVRNLLILFCLVMSFVLPASAAEEEGSHKITIQTYSNGKSYVRDNGKKITSTKGIQEYPKGSGKYYYFINDIGRIYCNKWFKKNGSYYYADKNGVLARGWKKISGKQYYFHKKKFTRTQGWKKLSGKYYYFSNAGVQVTKWLKWKNNTYYLDPSAKGAKTIGWKKIGKRYYYFNNRGRMQTGWLTLDGKKYYLSPKDGHRRSSLAAINGSKYYFNPKTGVMKTGWVTVNGKKYYFDKSSGKATTGWKKISGNYYYFNKKGQMCTGWVTLNGLRYYFYSSGKQATGTKTIGGKKYTFNNKTGGPNCYEQGIDPSSISGSWSIKVNRNTCVVTVYKGSTPVKAFLCSVGLNGATPVGTRYISSKIQWHALGSGNVWGQYCCHLGVTSSSWSSYLFHSVFYYTYRNNYSLATAEFRKLGQPASAGCIRLSCASAYYIWKNCPIGTKVTIFDGTSANDPLGKPANPYANWTGSYDPTDPITND